MEEKYRTKISKLLSLALRHNPEALGLSLDANGWASTADVVQAIRSRGYQFNHADLADLVANNDKQRFALGACSKVIRANQGHSIKVDLGLVPSAPPAILFHGTSSRYVGEIYKAGGLKKMSRQHVHLSSSLETASKVGSRHGGDLVIFLVHADQMHSQEFYQSENGVWLTDFVPIDYMMIYSKT